MSDNDDIEKLLREIDGVTASSGGTPVPRPQAQPQAQPERSSPAGTRQGAALAVAAVIGVVGLLLGWLPGVSGIWLGLGGFLGAYIAFTIGRRLS
jgi:ferric-dicitrate binding protein FerR (iron transport regulator)